MEASAPRLHLDIEAVFAERGIPYTRQRRLIWEFLSSSNRAASIAEAVAALQPESIGQSTVYRTIALMIDLGLVSRVQLRSGETCYTATRIGHTHPLICGVCRKVVDFDGAGDLSYLERQLERTTGFSIYGHHLEVYGVCSDCRAHES
jgi:Fe2+ or Zn2+ uptake regulation protein